MRQMILPNIPPQSASLFRNPVLTFALAVILQAPVQAQWHAVSSPTTNDLRGVCGAVAVGDKGTILQSGDGLAWAAQSSGVTADLNSVTFGAGLYVAVGANGMVVTSPDGRTWTTRTSGTQQTLHGVAHRRDASNLDTFVAVGDAGTVLTSHDAITWTAVTFDRYVSLHAVAGFADGFVIGGEMGTLLVTSDGTTFTRIATGVQSTVEAVAADGLLARVAGEKGLFGSVQLGTNPTWSNQSQWLTHSRAIAFTLGGGDLPAQITAGDGGYLDGVQVPTAADLNGAALVAFPTVGRIVVGQHGSIWVAPFPMFGSGNPAGNIDGPPEAFIGQSAVLAAPVQPGKAYQWYRIGAPMPGATQSTLTLTNIQPNDAGSYSVGESTATTLDMYVFPLITQTIAAFSPGLIDTTFKPIHHLSGTITPVPDGSLVENDGPFAGWYNADGSLRSWIDLASVTSVVSQPDGKVVVTGQTSPGVWLGERLNSDGSTDGAFHPTAAWFDGTSVLMPASNGGYWLVSATNSTLTWRLLLNNGDADPVFGTTARQVSLSFPGAVSADQPLAIVTAIDGHGRLLVGVNLLQGRLPFAQAALVRISADGSLDRSFTSQLDTQNRVIQQLQPVGEAIYAVTRLDVVTLPHVTAVVRLDSQGGLDPSWPPLSFPGVLYSTPQPVVLMPDGSTVALVLSRTDVSAISFRLERFDPTGALDRDFGAFFIGGPSDRDTGSAPIVTPLGNEHFLISGQFSSLNGVRSVRENSTAGDSARITVDTHYAATHLANLSGRANVTPNAPLTVGFTVSGAGEKQVLLRGVGPALEPMGVLFPLADPMLTLYSGTTSFFSNDDAGSSGGTSDVVSVGAKVQAFGLPPGGKDAAAVLSLDSGAYTMRVTGHGGSGVALGELYDADEAPGDATTARLINLSAQGQVAPGQPLIAGFVVQGTNAMRLLIRGVGPALQAFHVPSPLDDPVITVYQRQNTLTSNNDWTPSPAGIEDTDIETAAKAVGAFPLARGSKDSALLLTLPPGVYTAVVTSANNSSGQALVELYEVRP